MARSSNQPDGLGGTQDAEPSEIASAYRTHAAALYRYAIMLTADAAAAEDAIQQVFMKLVRRKGLPAIGAAFFIREVAYEAFVVVAARMSPTIRDGERVLVNKTIYDVEPMRRGDVVIVRSPDRIRTALVQRLAALPGDKIEIRGCEVLVNGLPVARPGAMPSTKPSTQPTGKVVEVTLPPGRGYFTSDNPDAMLGDHELGDLGGAPLSNIVGRVEFIYWPPLTRVQ
jgi:signal peptidase I